MIFNRNRKLKVICSLTIVLAIALLAVGMGGSSAQVAETPLNLSQSMPFSTAPSAGVKVASDGTVLYFDDVELGPNGWTATGFWHQITNAQTIYVHNVGSATPGDPPNDINPDLVTLPDTDASGHAYLPSAYSGNTAWWYGVDENGTFIDDPFVLSIQTAKNGGTSTEANSGSLTSPLIDLTGVSAATLNLKTWWEIEGVDADAFDMMYVKISTDGGATFTTIGALNPLNDVNNMSYQNYSSGGSNAVPVWVTSQFDLTSYVGHNVQLRFTFETVDNLYNGFRGWFIDDISVTAGGLLPPEVTYVEPDCIDDPTTILVINGNNFANGATVNIGGLPAASSAVISTSTIHALIDPSLGYGIYDVTVTNPDGASDTLPNAFTYAESCVGFVDVLSVDATLFPKIWAYVSVDTAAGYAGSLTQDDFEVYEDGVEQTIESFEFISETTTSKADIVFVFDDTGSMGGEIGTMKTKCKELTDAIEAAGIDARYALISFKDSPEIDQNWTSDALVFKSAVDALSALGGADEPEDNLDAIEMGLGLGFRAAAQKIMIDITDAHTHYQGDGSGYADYTMPEVADDLIGYGVTLFVVSPDFGTMTGTRDNQGMTVPLTSPSTDNQRRPIAPLTSSVTDNDKKILANDVGGLWLDINAADFAEILDSIVSVITTAYHIDYTTTNPSEDCTDRTVKITVHDPVQGTDSDTGVYKAPCAGFVDVLGVDATLFPKIWVHVSVDTAAGYAGSLTQDDFEVYENGVKQIIESFESYGAASKADIILVFDDTGSMWDEIDIMKTKCKELTDAIEAAGIDARYALISFKDSPEIDQNWTSDALVFKSAVDALSALGGADEPEDNLDAIEMGLGLGFRAEAQKIIIDITDAHTHYRGDGSGYADYTMPEVEYDLISYGVALFVVSPDFGTMTAVKGNQGMAVPLTSSSTDNDKKILAEDVGGLWIDIHAADFAEILDSIVGVITTAYHIDYTTTNPAEDCTDRTVKITVHDPLQGIDSDTGIYKAPCGEGVAPATAERSINPDSVAAGGTTTVSVTITAAQTLNGFALVEEPPAGWTVTEVDNDGAIFAPAEVSWVWVETLLLGESKTVIYKLTAPADAADGTYDISGLLMSYGIEDIEVGGEDTVTVGPEAGSWVYDEDDSGYIEISELLHAISDYIGGDLTISQLLELISLYIGHTPKP